ncbi:cytochrome c oxidase assembly factor Coa1 family protein [Agarivorans gilvus]|uniref:cytochrome c oxidase assembly factor Coa1 family protein n=1 Tax=Agarivorans gilvus TaxID=680279 RepID=UPI0035A23563
MFVAVIFLFVFTMIFGIGSLFKDSEPYKMSFNQVVHSQQVRSYLGIPIERGFISGNMQISGPEGVANLSYSIEGPKGEASVAVRAFKELNKWSIECLVVNYEGDKEQTTIVPCQ